jgi:hypothetical protein
LKLNGSFSNHPFKEENKRLQEYILKVRNIPDLKQEVKDIKKKKGNENITEKENNNFDNNIDDSIQISEEIIEEVSPDKKRKRRADHNTKTKKSKF